MCVCKLVQIYVTGEQERREYIEWQCFCAQKLRCKEIRKTMRKQNGISGCAPILKKIARAGVCANASEGSERSVR